jgi:hypothetical protein
MMAGGGGGGGWVAAAAGNHLGEIWSQMHISCFLYAFLTILN